MSGWLHDYLAQIKVQPLLADIMSGRVKPSALLLAIQQLSKEERREMKPALDMVIEAVRDVSGRKGAARG